MRKESLEKLVLTGKVERQGARGRQRLTFLVWWERAVWYAVTSYDQSTETSTETSTEGAFVRILVWQYT